MNASDYVVNNQKNTSRQQQTVQYDFDCVCETIDFEWEHRMSEYVLDRECAKQPYTYKWISVMNTKQRTSKGIYSFNDDEYRMNDHARNRYLYLHSENWTNVRL